MTFTVNFNDQLVLVAVEIQNKTIKRVLAAEFELVELLAAQSLPQSLLRRRHLATQFSGAGQNSRVDAFGWFFGLWHEISPL